MKVKYVVEVMTIPPGQDGTIKNYSDKDVVVFLGYASKKKTLSMAASIGKTVKEITD